MKCARCQGPLRVSSMSYFNEDVCCMECLADEKLAPGYAAAKATELEHVQCGDYRYRGVGLSRADREYLAARLIERRASEASKLLAEARDLLA